MATRSRYRAWHECRNACRLSWSITLGNFHPRRSRSTSRKALHSGLTMMLILGITVGLTIYLYIAIPKGFFPQQDTGRITGSIQADQSISFQAMQSKLV